MKIFEVSYPNFILKLIKIFNRNKVEYMIVGGASAIIQGYNGVTQDVDVYVDKHPQNISNIIKSLKALGFKLSSKDLEDLNNGKDFIQFNEPYELDLMFAPDGFENYAQAKVFKIQKDNIPLMSLDGIIKSKKAANRPKDKAMLPFLIDFNKFLKSKKESYVGDLFQIPSGYKFADVQTLQRWKLNEQKTVKEKLMRGLK